MRPGHMEDVETQSPQEAKPRGAAVSRKVLILIALVTAVSHFLLGVTYWRQWVNKEMKPLRAPLELQDESYLRV